MIPKAQAFELIAEFSGWAEYPAGSLGLDILIEALRSAASDADHALTTIKYLLLHPQCDSLGRKRCPSVEDIRDAARARPCEPEPPPRPYIVECPKCNDFGIVRREDGIREWCGCSVGRRMREKLPQWLDLVNGKRMPTLRRAAEIASYGRRALETKSKLEKL